MNARFRALVVLFALLPSVVAADYRMRPGDTLRLEVVEDTSLDRNILVAPDGKISVPLAGMITAGGRTVEEVRAALSAALSDDFAYPPTVFLSIAAVGDTAEEAAETIGVYVLGEVEKPGRIEVLPGTTILQVFSLAGGFSSFAATKRIQLRRISEGSEVIHPLDYDAIERGQSANGSVRVAEGDTFVVPVRRLFE